MFNLTASRITYRIQGLLTVGIFKQVKSAGSYLRSFALHTKSPSYEALLSSVLFRMLPGSQEAAETDRRCCAVKIGGIVF